MGKGLTTAVSALALTLALAPSAVKADIIDFDAIAATCCYGDVTPGGPRGPLLSFPDVDLDGGVVMDNTGWSDGETSFPNLYGTSDFASLADGSSLPGVITGTFSGPGVFTSIDLDVINGTFGAFDFTLTALDAASAVVDSAVVSLAAFTTPGFVGHLSVSGAGIKSFTVTSSQGTGGIDFGIDTIDLVRGPTVPEPGTLGMFGAMGLGLVSFVIRRRRA